MPAVGRLWPSEDHERDDSDSDKGDMMMMRGIVIMTVMIRVGMRVMMMVLTMQDRQKVWGPSGYFIKVLKKYKKFMYYIRTIDKHATFYLRKYVIV